MRVLALDNEAHQVGKASKAALYRRLTDLKRKHTV